MLWNRKADEDWRFWSYMNVYHEEFDEIIQGKTGLALITFLLDKVVEPVLKRNSYFYRCSSGDSRANAGICVILDEFRNYVAKGHRPPEDRIRLLGELAYTLWLLGDKFRADYEPMVQRRVNEFFKGTAYYDSGVAGFRQFEYELQTICRLVEEGITAKDSTLDGEPDLTVNSEGSPFQLEIKVPTANAIGALKKALRQINAHPGVVLICLDFVLYNEASGNKQNKTMEIAQQLLDELGSREDQTIVVEFYDDNFSNTHV
jgi:hypothetical protein